MKKRSLTFTQAAAATDKHRLRVVSQLGSTASGTCATATKHPLTLNALIDVALQLSLPCCPGRAPH